MNLIQFLQFLQYLQYLMVLTRIIKLNSWNPVIFMIVLTILRPFVIVY